MKQACHFCYLLSHMSNKCKVDKFQRLIEISEWQQRPTYFNMILIRHSLFYLLPRFFKLVISFLQLLTVICSSLHPKLFIYDYDDDKIWMCLFPSFQMLRCKSIGLLIHGYYYNLLSPCHWKFLQIFLKLLSVLFICWFSLPCCQCQFRPIFCENLYRLDLLIYTEAQPAGCQ